MIATQYELFPPANWFMQIGKTKQCPGQGKDSGCGKIWLGAAKARKSVAVPPASTGREDLGGSPGRSNPRGQQLPHLVGPDHGVEWFLQQGPQELPKDWEELRETSRIGLHPDGPGRWQEAAGRPGCRLMRATTWRAASLPTARPSPSWAPTATHFQFGQLVCHDPMPSAINSTH
jgi:hypothetical protein